MKKINCILLIDDNDFDNFYHSVIIEKTDHTIQVRTATNGEKALSYLEMGKKNPQKYPVPDLVFLDINMPGMNGFEFLEKARDQRLLSSGRCRSTIMLTSSLNPEDEKTARNKYAREIADFRVKPLSKEVLEEIMHGCLA